MLKKIEKYGKPYLFFIYKRNRIIIYSCTNSHINRIIVCSCTCTPCSSLGFRDATRVLRDVALSERLVSEVIGIWAQRWSHFVSEMLHIGLRNLYLWISTCFSTWNMKLLIQHCSLTWHHNPVSHLDLYPTIWHHNSWL